MYAKLFERRRGVQSAYDGGWVGGVVRLRRGGGGGGGAVRLRRGVQSAYSGGRGVQSAT